MSPPPSLSLERISKHFGPVRALHQVDFSLESGTVHALLGENGAGKSTLMHVAYGLIPADSGEIRIGGRPVRMSSPRVARAHGIGMVHQHFTSVPALTVAENIQLAGGRAGARLPAFAGFITGLELDARVEELSVGRKQQLEIVKALATDAKILLLDEPTAVLAPSEIEQLIDAIRAFASDGGSVVLITHKLDEALRAADFVTVLRQGVVTLYSAITGQTKETLAEAMIGEGLSQPVLRSNDSGLSGSAAYAVALEGVSVAPIEGRGPGLREASFSLLPGELVGVAAIEGNGQRELMLVVAGLLQPTSGSIKVAGPVALVPEDRTTEGLIPDFSLAENVALGLGDRGAWVRGPWIDWAEARRQTADLMAGFDVRAPGPDVAALALSGGNQQKLVLARALDQHPRVLVAENPTRGLDIRASAAVHARLRQAAADGIAVLVYSSDLDEILELAQRVVVVAGGRVVHPNPPLDRAVVGKAMLGLG